MRSSMPRAVYVSLPLLFAIAVSACGGSKSPAKPDKQGAEASPSASPSATPSTSPSPNPGTGTNPISVQLADPSASLQFAVGQPVHLVFNINNLNGRRFTAGLSRMPAGATLALDASSASFDWAVATSGTFHVVVLVRDLARCEAEEANASDCQITTSQFGTLTAKSYDVESQDIQIVVGTGTSDPLDQNGLGNGALIQQIMALLGGNGNGGIQNLLAGLSNGQLSQVLSSLQNGSGLDITQIIQMVLQG